MNNNRVLVYRGNGVEAEHLVSAAVVDIDGQLIASVGDPHLVTFTRSSIKPMQALPLIMSGAADKFGLSAKELAIACGSHNGSDDHKATAESILAKAGNLASQLQCGAHWPEYLKLKNVYPAHGEDQDPTRNNCSGKHAGFLAVARLLGDEPADYLSPGSHIQRNVIQALSDTMEYDISAAPTGIDGCSAPNYAVPLDRLANGLMKIAVSDSGPMKRIADAMFSFPEMVSGEGRFDLALSQVFPNEALAKVGAEALQVIAFRKARVALAVKIHDGAVRALAPACIEILRQLDLLKSVDNTPLAAFIRPQTKNHRRIVTGELRADISVAVKSFRPVNA